MVGTGIASDASADQLTYEAENRFLYDFVSKYIWRTPEEAPFTPSQIFYPNALFSASIISAIITDSDVKATAEWQLLLSTLAVPGMRRHSEA